MEIAVLGVAAFAIINAMLLFWLRKAKKKLGGELESLRAIELVRRTGLTNFVRRKLEKWCKEANQNSSPGRLACWVKETDKPDPSTYELPFREYTTFEVLTQEEEEKPPVQIILIWDYILGLTYILKIDGEIIHYMHFVYGSLGEALQLAKTRIKMIPPKVSA